MPRATTRAATTTRHGARPGATTGRARSKAAPKRASSPRKSSAGLEPWSAGRLTEWWLQAEPPGGWPLALLVLVGAVALVGLFLPTSFIGKPLQDAFGAASFLAVAWPAWFAWQTFRTGRIALGRSAAWAVLSVSLLVTFALRDRDSAGWLGRETQGALESGFGPAGGFVLLFLITIAAILALVGVERVLAGLAFLGQTARQLAEPRGERPVRVRPARPLRGIGIPTLNQPLPDLGPEQDIVILGPNGALPPEVGPITKAAEPPPSKPAVPAPRPNPADWNRPELKILSLGTDSGSFSPEDLKARARVIEETLLHFNVQARVVEIQQGPAITQFGLDPAPGVAVNKIVSRQHDLALRLGAPSLRVLAPVPGRALVGLEVPNASVATVKLGDLVLAPGFGKARLPIGIGMDVSGKPVVADLARMPHLLIAGATGSGKSVAINTLITSLLVAKTPDEVQLILIDPKQVEMSQYKELPHLRLPVVTDMDKVVATLRWNVLEMEKRYNRFSEVGARNIVAFNERYPDEKLPYLVIVIDELADMMMTAAEDVERLICRLAQLGRAAGVHLVVATQRPSVDVLTGLIKANLPTRIAFAVSSQIDSRVILDRVGAERLLGRGDALYQAGDEMNPRRVQGAYVSDEEIEELCVHWRAQGLSRHTAEDEDTLEKLARQDDPEEKLMAQARVIVAERGGDVTASYLARRLKIGTPKAVRIHQTIVADAAAAQAIPPPEEGG